MDEKSGVPVVVGRAFRKNIRTGVEDDVAGTFRARLDQEAGRLTVDPGPDRAGLLKRMEEGDYLSFEDRRLGVGMVMSIDLGTGTTLVELEPCA